MSKGLDQSLRATIRQIFIEVGSIKAVVRETGCSRNTVRKLLRAEGLTAISAPSHAMAEKAKDRAVSELDFKFLERLFELGKGSGENADFEQHIKTLVLELAGELEVKAKTDILRLESAIFQFIIYRRFYFLSLQVGDKRYDGPFSRSHERQANAVMRWVEASNKAFDQFNKLIRELEVKSGKRLPYWGGQSLVLAQTSVQIKNGDRAVHSARY
ncbi:MAG: hypothetical protein KF789_09535 [Bdellovibrionaceae bacterium]|nr:hypothetical protein [Pseudobdellovibrionaceae bacterium]